MGQMGLHIGQSLYPAVEHDRQVGEILLQPIAEFMAQRRDLPVLLGRQARQHGVAGMQHQLGRAGLNHLGHEFVQRFIFVPPRNRRGLDADPAFDRDRHVGRIGHRRNQSGDMLRFRHQAGAGSDDPDCTRSDGQPQFRLIAS